MFGHFCLICSSQKLKSLAFILFYFQRKCFIYMEPCKKSYRRYFECKCPGMRPACVGAGKYYDARCIAQEAVQYGRLWIQPWQRDTDGEWATSSGGHPWNYYPDTISPLPSHHNSPKNMELLSWHPFIIFVKSLRSWNEFLIWQRVSVAWLNNRVPG